jgi:hypothetical protein
MKQSDEEQKLSNRSGTMEKGSMEAHGPGKQVIACMWRSPSKENRAKRESAFWQGRGERSDEMIMSSGITFHLWRLYSKMFTEYAKIECKVQVNYQSVGSGAGKTQFLQQTVD